jgi:hypothetical protein
MSLVLGTLLLVEIRHGQGNHHHWYLRIYSIMVPPRVQNFVMLIAIEMHNSFEKQNSTHRDAICSRTLSGHIPSLQNTVPFDSRRVDMCLRKKRAEFTNSST